MNTLYSKIRNFFHQIFHQIFNRKSINLSKNLISKSSLESAKLARKASVSDLWAGVVIGDNAPHYQLKWKDIEMTKFPNDIYIYQQIIWQAKPDVIVEVGSQRGTSAQFFNELIKAAGKPNSVVITIDIYPVPEIQKSVLDSLGVIMITGDIKKHSTQQKVVPYIKDKNFLLVDDGSHRYEDVMASLQFFQKYQAPGNYMIVEDGITDVMLSRQNRNALEAVDNFLTENTDYLRVIDFDHWLLSTTFGGIIRRL